MFFVLARATLRREPRSAWRNRGGAFGNIANDIAAKSAPDGDTLLINAAGTITINPSIHSMPGHQDGAKVVRSAGIKVE